MPPSNARGSKNCVLFRRRPKDSPFSVSRELSGQSLHPRNSLPLNNHHDNWILMLRELYIS